MRGKRRAALARRESQTRDLTANLDSKVRTGRDSESASTRAAAEAAEREKPKPPGAPTPCACVIEAAAPPLMPAEVALGFAPAALKRTSASLNIVLPTAPVNQAHIPRNPDPPPPPPPLPPPLLSPVWTVALADPPATLATRRFADARRAAALSVLSVAFTAAAAADEEEEEDEEDEEEEDDDDDCTIGPVWCMPEEIAAALICFFAGVAAAAAEGDEEEEKEEEEEEEDVGPTAPAAIPIAPSPSALIDSAIKPLKSHFRNPSLSCALPIGLSMPSTDLSGAHTDPAPPALTSSTPPLPLPLPPIMRMPAMVAVAAFTAARAVAEAAAEATAEVADAEEERAEEERDDTAPVMPVRREEERDIDIDIPILFTGGVGGMRGRGTALCLPPSPPTPFRPPTPANLPPLSTSSLAASDAPRLHSASLALIDRPNSWDQSNGTQSAYPISCCLRATSLRELAEEEEEDDDDEEEEDDDDDEDEDATAGNGSANIPRIKPAI